MSHLILHRRNSSPMNRQSYDGYYSRRLAEAAIPEAKGTAFEDSPSDNSQHDAQATTTTESDAQIQDQSPVNNSDTIKG
jgi:hypothetical protein